MCHHNGSSGRKWWRRQHSSRHTGQQTKEQQRKREGENICLHQRVENYHVSIQSRHGGTRKLEERNFNGILVRPASTQKQATSRKKRAQEKSGEQRRIE
jgi:hypothetical protein